MKEKVNNRVNEDIILKILDLSKNFLVVKALDNISFELKKGEVLGLVGENGAGKSTLVNILGGVYKKDKGKIFIGNELVEINNPIVSMGQGINIVHQELTVLGYLSVAENVLVGDLPRIFKSSIINWNKTKNVAKKILKKLNVDINPNTIVDNLSIANKRIVEIARAIHGKGKILILDEPTTALSDNEVKVLFNVIKELKKEGVSVIFISHLLDEVLEICDRVIVLRDGKLVCDKNCSMLDRESVVKYMVGRDVSEQYPKKEPNIKESILTVNGLSYKNYFKDISFKLKRGEILAFYGLLGSGCNLLVRTLFGILFSKTGQVKINNRDVVLKNPINSIRNGIGYVPSDRKFEGISSSLNVKQNISLADIDSLGKGIFINKRIEDKKAKYWVDKLRIRISDIDQKIEDLSGGNKQKVLISRWLNSDSEILILDEPTKGIDVGAKTEIYNIMEDICIKGAAVIMVSVDIEEIIGIADRVLVFSRGKISKELNGSEINKKNLLYYASKV